MPALNAAWATKVARFRAFMTQAGPGHSLLSVAISTLGGWHFEAHRAILSIASGITSRAVAEFDRARNISLPAPCRSSCDKKWFVTYSLYLKTL